MKVYPASGGQVPDPERGDYLPESGRNVSKTQYWLRRIKDGDVTLNNPTKSRGKSNGRKL
jgi:hypothetical protein